VQCFCLIWQGGGLQLLPSGVRWGVAVKMVKKGTGQTQKPVARTRNARGAGRKRDQDRLNARKAAKKRRAYFARKVENAVQELSTTPRKRGRNVSSRVRKTEVHQRVAKHFKKPLKYVTVSKRIRQDSSLSTMISKARRTPRALPRNQDTGFVVN